MVEYQIFTAEIMCLILTLVQLHATLNKLLIYCVLRQTQPPVFSATGHLQLAVGRRPSVAGRGVVGFVRTTPLVQLSVSVGKWMAALCTAAHAIGHHFHCCLS